MNAATQGIVLHILNPCTRWMPPSRSGHFATAKQPPVCTALVSVEEEYIFPLQCIKPRLLGRPACSIVPQVPNFVARLARSMSALIRDEIGCVPQSALTDIHRWRLEVYSLWGLYKLFATAAPPPTYVWSCHVIVK
jgi:hypothetical protein